LQPAVLRVEPSGISVDLAEGEDGVSPGQACVLYAGDERGERLLGGGWIKSTEAAAMRDSHRARHVVAGTEALAAGQR
jgi:tRNA-specific 2-thiouridylase